MRPALRTARLVLAAVALLAVGSSASSPREIHGDAHRDLARPQDPSASMRPEVRLRKLHLVRPDLIPYPIAYETYC
jgi:hypothetical protein